MPLFLLCLLFSFSYCASALRSFRQFSCLLKRVRALSEARGRGCTSGKNCDCSTGTAATVEARFGAF